MPETKLVEVGSTVGLASRAGLAVRKAAPGALRVNIVHLNVTTRKEDTVACSVLVVVLARYVCPGVQVLRWRSLQRCRCCRVDSHLHRQVAQPGRRTALRPEHRKDC